MAINLSSVACATPAPDVMLLRSCRPFLGIERSAARRRRGSDDPGNTGKPFRSGRHSGPAPDESQWIDPDACSLAVLVAALFLLSLSDRAGCEPSRCARPGPC